MVPLPWTASDTFAVSLTDLSLTVGTVFQDVESQLINAVVEDELYYGLENFGVPKAEADARVDEVLQPDRHPKPAPPRDQPRSPAGRSKR